MTAKEKTAPAKFRIRSIATDIDFSLVDFKWAAKELETKEEFDDAAFQLEYLEIQIKEAKKELGRLENEKL
jgi:hypothetical protein